jgi:hypothetical protein
MRIHSLNISGFAGLGRLGLRLDDGRPALLRPDSPPAEPTACDDRLGPDVVGCLTALLYDFQTPAGRFDAAARAACAPASADEPYAAEMEFSIAGGRWVLTRDFRERTVQLADAVSGEDVTEQYLAEQYLAEQGSGQDPGQAAPEPDPGESACGAPAGGTAAADVGTRLLGITRIDFLRMAGAASPEPPPPPVPSMPPVNGITAKPANGSGATGNAGTGQVTGPGGGPGAGSGTGSGAGPAAGNPVGKPARVVATASRPAPAVTPGAGRGASRGVPAAPPEPVPAVPPTPAVPPVVESLRQMLERAATSDGNALTASAGLEAVRRARQKYRDTAGLSAPLPESLDDLLPVLRRRVTEAEAEIAACAALAGRRRELTARVAAAGDACRSLRAEFDSAGGPAAFAELAELDASLLADEHSRETLRRLLPERDRLAGRAEFPADREADFTRQADKVRASSAAAKSLETRAASLEAELAALGPADGPDEEQLRSLAGLADRLAEAEDRRAAAVRSSADAPAGVEVRFAEGFAGLSSADQERCRRAGPGLREIAVRRGDAERRSAETAARAASARMAHQVRLWPGRGLLLASGLLFLAVLADVVSPADLPGATVVWLVLVAAGGAGGAVLLWQARVVADGTLVPAERAWAAARADLERADREALDLREQLRHAVTALGALGASELADRIEGLSASEPGRNWLTACRALADAAEEIARLRRQAHAVVSAMRGPGARPDGDPRPQAEITAAVLRAAAPEVEARLEASARRRRLSAELEAVRAELPGRWAELEAARDGLSALLTAVGLDRRLEPDAAVTAFRSALRDHERFRELAGKLIPEAEARRLPDAESARRARRRTELRDRMVAAGAAIGLPPDASVAACLAAGRSKQAKLEAAERELARLRAELEPVWNDSALRPAAARRNLEAARLDLEQADRADRVLRLTRESLERARTSVYNELATRLNAAASQIAAAVLPAFGGLYFRPDLSFTLKQSNGRMLQASEIDAKLTPATRERLILAVRLCLAEALRPDPDLGVGTLPSRRRPTVPLLVDAAAFADDPSRRGAPGVANAAPANAAPGSPQAARVPLTPAVKAMLHALTAGRQVCVLGGDPSLRPDDGPRSESEPRSRLQPARI